MAKIKLTKGELKRQRDALKQYRRYLPTLQLKKQQLQAEILHEINIFETARSRKEALIRDAKTWAGFLEDKDIFSRAWVTPERIALGLRNIAGVDVPIFERAEYGHAEYDLFLKPLWVDAAIDALRAIRSLAEELAVLEKGVAVLRHELRITTQRVNLFEKVKIPDAEEAIRGIKIYIGDQMTNAVGRSKAAKKKIEAAEVLV